MLRYPVFEQLDCSKAPLLRSEVRQLRQLELKYFVLSVARGICSEVLVGTLEVGLQGRSLLLKIFVMN